MTETTRFCLSCAPDREPGLAEVAANPFDWGKVYGLRCGWLFAYFARQSGAAGCQVCSNFKGV